MGLLDQAYDDVHDFLRQRDELAPLYADYHLELACVEHHLKLDRCDAVNLMLVKRLDRLASIVQDK